MAKFRHYLNFLFLIGLTSCGSSSVSTSTESTINPPISSDTSIDDGVTSPSADTTSTTIPDPIDYGTTNDEFNTEPGNFALFDGESDNLSDLSTIYGGYYKNLKSWANGIDLKHQLFNIIYDEETFTPLSYGGNWSTNQNADQSLYNFDFVRPLYNIAEQSKTDTYSASNTYGWQREHAFCASLLTGLQTSQATTSVGIATDFHNLFASNSGGNASRSDKNFGMVSDVDDAKSIATTNRRPGYNYKASDAIFEPNDSEKGMLSRAIFYMATMYGQDSWNNNKYKVGDGVYIRENTCTISDNHCIGNSSTLVNWANTFKVDRYEYQHNAYVFSEQHNRNPFVDFPNLVDYVFGNKKNQPGSVSDLVSSYSYLEIEKSTSYSNLAIDNVKTSYEVGESIRKTDVNVYNVMKDFSKVKNDNYVMMFDTKEITDSYVIKSSDVGEHKIQIVTTRDFYSYPIKVQKQGLESCSEVHSFMSYLNNKDTTSRDEIRNKSFNTPNANWTITFNNLNCDESSFITSISGDSTYGVKIGSSTKYCESMVLTSSKVNNVNLIFLRGSLTAGTTEKITFNILDDLDNVIFTSSSNINKDYQEASASLTSPLSGKIQIIFNNVNHKALYLSAIAFNAINS